MKLAKLAENLAVGNLIKGRIEDSISTLKEMKDREILQAIELLKSVKEAYETNKAKITIEVANIPLRYGQSINWSKVNEMIENSIDWNKVVDLLKQVVPPQNIEKIKAVQNQAKISEYKNLVNFLMGKVSSWKKREIQYLDYWSPPSLVRTTTSSSSTSTYKPTTSSSSSSSGGCYIATMAYGSYEHPQVMVLRQFRDIVLYKSVLGRWFIKFYYHYSPKLVEALKDKQIINKSIRYILNQFIKIIK